MSGCDLFNVHAAVKDSREVEKATTPPPRKELGGNDLPDAWLAAAVDHQGEHLVSFDRDFKKLLGRARFTLLEA